MPLTIGPDPNNPGAWIWIDSETGQPAAQPGGPNTPYVAGTSTSSTGSAPPVEGSAAKKSLDAIAAAQGEGWSVTSWPTPKTDANGIPVLNQYTVVLSGPGGAQRIGTVTPPSGVDTSKDPLGITWTLTGIEEPIKTPTTSTAETSAAIEKAKADAEASKAMVKQREAELLQLETDNTQRTKNQTANGYYVTDKELADIKARGAEQGLTQQQINNQLKIAGDNNAIARTSNEIAAENAKTSLFTAQKNAEEAERRTKIASGQLDLDGAKFEREKDDRDIANRLAQDKLKLDQLQQRQASEVAARQVGASEKANVIRGQELDQRATEAQQTAETAAIGQGVQAAASTLGTERQFQANAAQTGGNLLQNRASTFQNLSQAPFTQAANLSQGSAGRYGMLGGGLHGVPEGAVANIMQGAMGVSTGLYGGQNALSAAAQAIEQIRPGAAMTPMGQAAAAIIAQMQERTQQLLKKGQVNAPSTAGAAAAQPAAAAAQPAAQPAAAAVAAPVTVPLPENQYQGNFAGQDIQELMRNQMQQHLAPQMAGASAMTAPRTMPTININF